MKYFSHDVYKFNIVSLVSVSINNIWSNVNSGLIVYIVSLSFNLITNNSFSILINFDLYFLVVSSIILILCIYS